MTSQKLGPLIRGASNSLFPKKQKLYGINCLNMLFNGKRDGEYSTATQDNYSYAEKHVM